MANENKGGSGGIGTAGIFWVALLGAGALLLRTAPWEGARPSSPDAKPYETARLQDVDARLWQDPFTSVAQARKGVPSTAQGRSASLHAPDRLAQDLCLRSTRGKERVLVVGAMVSGSSYTEQIEFRRRARYAILAGLNEAGFVPNDSEHLGYFEPVQKAPEAEDRLPDFIAYEWMSRKEIVPSGSAKSQNDFESTLLLWLDEDVLSRKTFDRLDDVRTLLGSHPDCQGTWGDNMPGPPLVVLGPSLTGSLRGMVKAARDREWKGLTFYTYATADDALILSGVSAENTGEARTVQSVFAARGVPLYRTIATDRALAAGLAQELELRRLNPQDDGKEIEETRPSCPAGTNPRTRHIVFISEWDTLYGRSLPVTMSQELAQTGAGHGAGSAVPPARIHTYSYLRGLDGQIPGRGGGTSDGSKGGAADSGGGSKGGDRSAEEKRIERPEGESQFDYVRRLVSQLRSQDEEWRLRGCGRIEAVGVLGSDVYDKLLVLQALRAELPSATTFTTDLDTRLLHPKQLEWTRNAIVASSYGLTLDRKLQRDIPPFRDSYQTSMYLSSIIAVSNARRGGCTPTANGGSAETGCISQGTIDAWLESPRVFEIGRKAPFDFSPRAAEPNPADCSPMRPTACTNVHGPPSSMYPNPPASILRGGLLLLVAGGLLLGFATGTWARLITWAQDEVRGGGDVGWRRRLRAGLALTAIAAVALLAYRLTFHWTSTAELLTENGKGEPIAFVLGVSAWPTELMRIASAFLSVGFVGVGWRMLDGNLDEISKTFMWKPQWRALLAQLRERAARWPWWKQFAQMLSFRLEDSGGDGMNPTTGLSEAAEMFWYRYLYQNRFWARVLRVLLATGLYFAGAFLVIRALGAPQSPLRGRLLGSWNGPITILSVFLMLFLIFFVVDATVFCIVLLRALRWQLPEERGELDTTGREASIARWPQSTLDYYASQMNVDKSFLDDWVTLQFVAKRTRVVAGLVYLPFVVIALMIASRSSIFDRWGTNTGLLVVHTASVAIVIGCGIMLRQAAEDLRRRSIRRLSERRIGLLGQDDAARRTAGQVDLMIAQIKAIDTGAFAPYSQQPIVRALLLPLSSYGGAALVEYLSIAGF